MITLSNIKVGQEVSYKSSASTYTGKVVKVNKDSLIVVDDESGMALHKAGYKVGSQVYAGQLV